MKTLVCFAYLFFVPLAIAEPMYFEVKKTSGKCCGWIQATGDITPDTPSVFETFLRSSESIPKIVRLDSRGGSTGGGVALGELFRARGFATEVGSTKLSIESAPVSGSENDYSKTPGRCGSACAFAFLGGIERKLDHDSSLGFHLFSPGYALSNNDVQKLTSALLLYIVNMGVDARLLELVTEAGPNEVRWIRPDEARELRVTTIKLPNRAH